MSLVTMDNSDHTGIVTRHYMHVCSWMSKPFGWPSDIRYLATTIIGILETYVIVKNEKIRKKAEYSLK